MKTLQVRKGSTDTLLIYGPMTPELLYQPSAADLRLQVPGQSMTEEGSELSATVDPVSTTLSAAADQGAESVVVASAAGITDHRLYLIVSEGRRFVVPVRAVNGTTVYLAEELPHGVVSGATFLGIAVTYQLTAELTTQIGGGLAKWRLTLNGTPLVVDHHFEIVVSVFPLTLTPHRLQRRPLVRRLRDSTMVTYVELIQTAWTDELRPRLRASGLDDELINSPAEVERAHIEACIYLLMRDADKPDEELDAQDRRLDRAISDLKASTKWAYDANENDGAEPEERAHLDESEIAWAVR